MQLRLLVLAGVLCTSWWVGGAGAAVSRRTSLELNDSLSAAGAEPLFSNASNPTFMLSFRAFGSPAASSSDLYLCISFVVNVSMPGQCVWTANRVAAVDDSASLELTASGSLVLSERSAIPNVWDSETSGLNVVRALLLNSGNLVLVNRSGSYVWQSFLNPTDTLLPGQAFTPESVGLTSNKRASNFSSGRYWLRFNRVQQSLQLLVDSTSQYWSSSGNIFKFDEFGNITLYNSPSSINSTFVANDYGTFSAMRRITLDVDGNLRMYTWNATSAVWSCVWMAFPDECGQVGGQGLCGSYGVCVYNPIQPTCMCPQGFSVVDPTDLSSGCTRNHKINSCTSIKYVEIENVDYPDNDISRTPYLSVDECKNSCTTDCSCMVAVYWQSPDGYGTCWLKQIALNGRSQNSQKHRVFLKISASDPLVSNPIMNSATQWSSQSLYSQASNQSSPNQLSTPNQPSPHQSNSTYAYLTVALAVVSGILALCVAGTLAALIRSSRSHVKYMKLHNELEGSSPRLFSYEELRAATQNFSHKLGAGGFSSVYKGLLQSGKVVAVKQLEGVSAHLQEKQFRAEIMTIGRIHHINLLSLVGFCSEGTHRLLVYEYMEKGSLDQVLFEKEHSSAQDQQTDQILDWKERFEICLGVARGIHYLHEECLDCILHCDIKPQNILLDGIFSPKVADFGLAYLYSRDHTVKTTTIRGTRGYLAPEWLSNLPITSKADVYSYGMLILEIVSGRSNYVFSESTMMEATARWCFPAWAYGKHVEDVVDTRLIHQSSVDLCQVTAVMEVGFACIQADMNARPSMGQVVQMLEGTLPIPHPPPPSLFPAGQGHPCPVSSSASGSGSSSSQPLSASKSSLGR